MQQQEAAIVTSPVDDAIVETGWGRLVWHASGEQGNSATMTVGKCHIRPGEQNPRHFHPNCDEILHVLAGRIEHTADDDRQVMNVGDTISIPANVVHNARNIGGEEAVLMIVFSSPDREVVGE